MPLRNEHGFDGDAEDDDRGWMDAKLGFVPMGALLDVSFMEGSGPTAGLGEQARSSSEKDAQRDEDKG